MSGPAGFTDGPQRNAVNAPRQASSHYDRHTQESWAKDAPKNFADARQKRWEDKTYQLKNFHNEVKRAMVNCLTVKGGSLLDLACGRGGDMQKWFDAKVGQVTGIDISIEEVSTARKRLLDLKERKRRADIPYRFEVRADLGTADVAWDTEYASVTCMFAAHYFFATEGTLKTFLGNASRAMADRAYFFGTVPSGKHVLQCLNGKDTYRSPILALERTWPGRFKEFTSFGSGYKFAMVKTVTNDSFAAEEAGEGCEEYLVFMGAFTQIAALYHLFPEPHLDWNFHTRKSRGEEAFFQPGPVDGKHTAFRTFNPKYDRQNPDSEELEKISRMNAAFVFKKDEHRPCPPGCLLHGHQAAVAASTSAAAAAASAPAHRPADSTPSQAAAAPAAEASGSTSAADSDGMAVTTVAAATAATIEAPDFFGATDASDADSRYADVNFDDENALATAVPGGANDVAADGQDNKRRRMD